MLFRSTNAKEPLKCENNCFTMKGLCVFSDGRDYTERVEELLGLPASDGTKPRRYDPERFAQLKKEAMEELSAIGVTFPVTCWAYLKAGGDTSSALVTQQNWKNDLGDDFIKYDWFEYVADFTQEVQLAKTASIYVNGWALLLYSPPGCRTQGRLADPAGAQRREPGRRHPLL